MALTQEHRRLAISSPLGEDVLLFRRMTVSEKLGELFSCDLEILSEDHDIRLDDLVGQNLSVRYEMPESGQMRYFHGVVSQFRYAGVTGNLALYHAQLRPWLWFLTRTTDSRIFQKKTVPDIIKEIFRDYGFTDFDDRLSETYRTWEYCVQHRETDCNFVCRLMEQEGIYFYFLHEADKHTLVLADSISGHDLCPGYERVPYYPADSADVREEDHISDWSVYQEAQPGACTLRAFDFKAPKKNLDGHMNQPLKHAFADFEIYDYADDYWEPDLGQTYARIRLEESHGQFERVQGSGNVSGFFAGGLFEYYGYPRSDQNREYLIISTSIELSQDIYETGSSGGGESFCQCHFTALDSQRPFRTPRNTPKPLVQGPQTAMVVGPAGEEIYTDEHSRVKIQFHWDREGSNDENSSCWIRVSQPWAGKAWGGIAIPRIGQEVIVSFLEGDPDKPMITGRVYNGDSMPPYSLPGNMTQTGLKSRSSKGGTGDNFNEIRFEDKKGEEQLFIHAEKNQDIEVENDETHWVGHDRTKTIDNDETTHVKHDRTETVDNNETIMIHANRTETVDKDETITIHQNRTETVDVDETITIGANRTEKVGKNESVSIGANRSHDVGSDDTLGVGKNLVMTAGDQITIRTGSASIVMKKSGDITINGKQITIKGSGDVIIKGKKILEN